MTEALSLIVFIVAFALVFFHHYLIDTHECFSIKASHVAILALSLIRIDQK